MAIFYPTYLNATQDAGFQNTWSGTGNIIDTVSGTFAVCAAYYDVDLDENLTASLYIDTASGINRTDYITKVEVCVIGYSDIAEDYSIITVLDSTNYDIVYEQEINLTRTNDEYWNDITNAPFFPGYGFWTWLDIENLRVLFTGYIPTTEGITTTFYIDEIKVKVTTQDDPIPRYGLRCKDENNNTTLDVTDGLSRVLYNGIFEANSTEVTLDFDRTLYDKIIGFSYCLENNKIAHRVEQDWITISGSVYTETWSINSESITVGDHVFPSGRSNVVIMGY